MRRVRVARKLGRRRRERLAPFGTWALAAVFLLGTGCDGSDAPDVVAGQVTIHSASPAWNGTAGWSIDSTPDLVLPQHDSVFFHSVVGGFMLGDGSIAVGDGGREEILVFLANGSLVGILGGRGEGPGEFRSLARIAVDGADTIVAWESDRSRATLFSSSGAVRTRPGLPGGRVPGGAERWVVSPGGTAFVMQVDQGSAVPPSGAVRPERFLGRFDPHGKLDTLAVFRGREVVYVNVADGLPMPTSTLFAPNTEMAGGGLPWRFAVGDGAAAVFEVRDQAGSLVRRVSWVAGERRLSESDVTAMRSFRIEEGTRMRQALAEERVRALPTPSVAPVYRSLFVDDLNCVWVERFPFHGVTEGTWAVFDSVGAWLGEVRLPDRGKPLQIGADFLLLLRRDSVGVETVARHRLLR